MPQLDTTNNGVSDDKNAEDYISKQAPLDRDIDMNDIVSNSKKAREMADSGVDMKNPMEVRLAQQKIDAGEDPNPNAGLEDPDLEKDEGLEKDSEPEMIDVKINGVEKQALKSDVDNEGGVVNYQKNRSADEKMRQNATERRHLDEKSIELAQRELAISQQEQAQLSNKDLSHKPSSDASGPSEEALALKDKMYSGDEDQAAEAIDTILERGNNASTPVDTNALANQVAAQVMRKNDIQKAKDNFAAEYKDIDSNPEYRNYANQATKRIGAENPSWTIAQIINEAGDQARLKFRDELREFKQDAKTEERINNKRTTDNVRGGNARVVDKPADKPLTRSEVVAKMMENRSHSTN